MTRRGRFLLALLGLVGCQTPYMPYDCEPGSSWPPSAWSCKGGYSELELGPETYQVGFSGRDISSAKSRDYTLLRAAELTLERGHRYFVVVQAWGETDVQLHGGTQTSQTVPTGKGSFTMGTGGGTSSTRLPQASYVIRILDDAHAEDPNAYDALRIQASVRSKYRLSRAPSVASER